MQDIDRFN